MGTQSGPCNKMDSSGTKTKCEFAEKLIAKNFARVFPHVTTLLHPMATWKEETTMPSEWSTVTFGWVGDDAELDAKSAIYDDMTVSHAFGKITAAVDSWLQEELPAGALVYYSAKTHGAAWTKPEGITLRLQSAVRRGRENPYVGSGT